MAPNEKDNKYLDMFLELINFDEYSDQFILCLKYLLYIKNLEDSDIYYYVIRMLFFYFYIYVTTIFLFYIDLYLIFNITD